MGAKGAVCVALLFALCSLLSGCLTPAPSPPPVPTAEAAPTPTTEAAPVPIVVATAEPTEEPTLASAPAADLSLLWMPLPRTKTSACVSIGGLPDRQCTPGAISPRVSQETTATTICVSGFTATVRPSTSVTDRIKVQVMAAYGLQGQPARDYELDHLISLELGGAAQDVANLWPERWDGDMNAHMKDSVENFLKRAVCGGLLSLAAAQREIASDWVGVYRSRHLTPAETVP